MHDPLLLQDPAGHSLTNHQAIVEQTLLAQTQLADLIAQHDTGYDCSSRRSQAPTQRDGVDDVYFGLDGERALVVASQKVQGYTGDQVDLGVEGDLLGALALVFIGNGAVQGQVGRGFGVDCDVEFEMEGQREADHIETGANVGRGARGSDDEGGHLESEVQTLEDDL